VIVAVADAGPIIHLAEIESLELFSALDTLLVPTTVYEELEAGGVPAKLSGIDYETVESSTNPDWVSDELDAGEIAALAVANEENAILLTDDLAARRVATDAGIEVHGSVGLIALAFNRDVLDRPTAIRRMRALQGETSLFVTDAVIEKGSTFSTKTCSSSESVAFVTEWYPTT